MAEGEPAVAARRVRKGVDRKRSWENTNRHFEKNEGELHCLWGAGTLCSIDRAQLEERRGEEEESNAWREPEATT